MVSVNPFGRRKGPRCIRGLFCGSRSDGWSVHEPTKGGNMGRRKREHKQDLLIHVTAHAIPDRLCCPDQSSRTRFVQLALSASTREPCRVHAYAMMDNHIHLLMAGERDGAIGRMLKWLLGQHAVCLNKVEGRSGPLWRDRYTFIPIENEVHLLRSHLYIEANPWRAGLVEHPNQSTWTSFHFNGLGQKDELLSPHEVLLNLAGQDGDWRAAYRQFMDEYIQTAIRYKSPNRKAL